VVPEKVNEKSGKMSPQQARLKGHVTGGISPNYFQQHRAINHFGKSKRNGGSIFKNNALKRP